MKPRPQGPAVAQDAAFVAASFQQATVLHRQGRSQQADALCAQVLRADATHYGAWHLRGLVSIETNSIAQGIDWIERSLRLRPDQPVAHSNIGNALLSSGQAERALERFDAALRLKSDYPAALYNRGNALRALRRFDAALAGYDRTLFFEPQHARALNNRGLVLLELGRVQEALESFERACRSQGRFVEAEVNRAAVLLKLDRAPGALEACEEALRMAPGDVGAWCVRADTLLALGQPDEALGSYARALQIDPGHVEGWIGRGNVLQCLQRYADAVNDYEQALRLTPGSELARNNCGNALLAQGRAQAALEYYDRALEISPRMPMALYNRGAALRELKRYEEAAQAFAQVLGVVPDHEYALGNLFHVRLDCCDWTDYTTLARALQESLAREQRLVNPLSLLLADSPELQLACARAYQQDRYRRESGHGFPPSRAPLPAGRISPPSIEAPPSAAPSSCVALPHAVPAPDRIRVAYVSADFREHPVCYALVGALEHHDRRDFEIIGVSLRSPENSELGLRVHASFDRFVDVAGWTDRDVAALLGELQADIAVDLMGFTQGSRPGIFEQRAAGVQVSYLGYAGTTGAGFIDYLVADEVVIPEGQEDCYAEQIARLPNCYLPTDDRRAIAARVPTRAEAGLPAEGLVFCAFTTSYKLNPPTFDVWMRLLRELHGSVLWLRATDAGTRRNLQREAHERGVDAARLIFAPYLANMAEHLARKSLADLYLDTLPCNAHSTACDALWAGVPVLTCTGRSFASRVAASALTAVGLSELITGSLQEYEHRALELARSPQRRQALRARLLQCRGTAALFDTAGYTRQLEQAYRTMHERHLLGLEPRSFRVAVAVAHSPGREAAAGGP